MDITVKGKNMDVGDSLRGHVQETLKATVGKYFDRALDAAVTFTREAHEFRVDVQVHARRGMLVQGENHGADVYGAFDGVLERIDKQLRRYKRRLTDYHHGREDEAAEIGQSYVLAPEAEGAEEQTGEAPVIIAEMPTAIETLSVGQAVMRMDLTGVPVLMFRNQSRGTLNVVYRRNDGNIGWIDPEGAK